MDFDTPILFSVFRKKTRAIICHVILKSIFYKCTFNETNVNIVVVFMRVFVHGKFLRGFFDRGLKFTCKKGGSIWYFCLIISALFGI